MWTEWENGNLGKKDPQLRVAVFSASRHIPLIPSTYLDVDNGNKYWKRLLLFLFYNQLLENHADHLVKSW